MSPNNTHERNRNRRVTDKAGGLLDAAQQAIRLERIEGDMRLLTQRVSSGMENVSATLAAVQVEVRGCSTNVSELRGLQGAHDSNKVAIDKVEKSVTDLGARLESWFDEFEAKQEQRWRDYQANRDQWRREHEAENENVKKDLEKEIRSVRETVIRFVGFGSAIGALAGVIVAGFLWNINYRFTDNKEDTDRVEKSSAYNRQLIDAMGVEHGRELSDIKLYLARGGRIPEEPYVPQSQRKENGHEQSAASSQPAK